MFLEDDSGKNEWSFIVSRALVSELEFIHVDGNDAVSDGTRGGK